MDADLSISVDSIFYGAHLVVKVTTNTKFTDDIVVYAMASIKLHMSSIA